MMYKLPNLMLAALVVMVGGCRPAEPPPDLVRSQREALNKAKAVAGQLQQQAQEQKQAADDAEK